jgi:regulator of RNase E activity RraA
VNRPINVGGVLVRPGDVVLADGDGVIVVPREHAEEVAGFARGFLDNIGKERYEQRQKMAPPAAPAPR